MFDIGIGEFLLLGVLALLVFGPDRLPRVTAQATAMLRQLREQAASAREEISAAVDLESTGLKDLADLHPRRIARSVLEPVDQARAEVADAVSSSGSPARPAAAPTAPGTTSGTTSGTASPRTGDPSHASGSLGPGAASAPPAYDPDAT